MSWLLGLLLAAWAGLHVIRFALMYRTDSPWQAWRRYDLVGLVPVGSFFSPGVPRFELVLAHRGLLPSGTFTAWALYPPAVRRQPWHVLWNPGKQGYRALTDVGRELLQAAELTEGWLAESSPRVQLSDPYLRALRLVSERLQRGHDAVQFALLEVDADTGTVNRSVLSAVHTTGA